MVTSPQPNPTRHSAASVLRLAGPVIVAELGWMSMQLVDTLLVRHLGPTAIGAVGLGGAVFVAFAVFGMGLLMGLDPLVAQAVGAGRADVARGWLHHGVVLALLIAVPTMLVLTLGPQILTLAGIHQDVQRPAAEYLSVLIWSLPTLLVFAACRRYLQAWSAVRAVMLALVSANVINALADWVFINGYWGAPRLGVAGAAWATVASRAYLAGFACLSIRALHRDSAHAAPAPWKITLTDLVQLMRLGLPAAGQITIEVGAFSLATTIAGRMAPASLAAHQIALNLWSLVFMVPLGIASAAAVLVGHGVGRRDAREAREAGWHALRVGVVFMAGAAVLFLSVPAALVRIFASDAAVIETGRRLLMVCAVFQLFDGLQVVATGALRGLGDTRTAMRWNLAGHWLLGLPLGYGLAFGLGWGVVGLWVGLSVGLVLIGAVLVHRWQQRAADLERVVSESDTTCQRTQPE